MQLPGRLSAAIEILDDVLTHGRPAAMALSDWARSHRFAGAKDRAAIGNLVYDALRRKASLSQRMQDETARALVLGVLRFVWGADMDALDLLCDGSRFAPAALVEVERRALGAEVDPAVDAGLPAHVAGDYPAWLAPSMERVFGAEAALQGAALARRAPLDIRANTLKTTREKLQAALARHRPEPTPLAPAGLRIAAPAAGLASANARLPHIEAESAHGKGWFEVQDEASQLAACLAGARPGMQVADICAGGGGKTLAMAAHMENKGQIHAWDLDKHRLRPIWERLKRAGLRNVQVLESGEAEPLQPLHGRMDMVLADAPCTGSGSWRRKPDAKWRLSPEALASRVAEQRRVLQSAAPLVRPGGQLVYVTCSLLAEENTDQAAWFLENVPGFTVRPYEEVWRETLASPPPASADAKEGGGLLLSPAGHGTDGFFIAVFSRVD
ncbi:MAG: MFS transporter [Hyphomicrobiales bacterium]|nr:MAG: MFS transporter [Hyphomicrobiales bacterium]